MQAHTALMLAADCLQSPGGAVLLRSSAGDSSSACHIEIGPFLLLLSQLRALWSQQPHFDAVCLELVSHLLELAVATVRDVALKERVSVAAQEAADSSNAETSAALLERAMQMLLQLEPLTQAGSSLPLMTLLPALEATLSQLFAHHRQLCSSFMEALLPASIWRRCRAGPEVFASLFQWIASCDYHSSLMVSLLRQSRSETSSSSSSGSDDGGPDADAAHDMLRGTARTVSGSIHRGLMRAASRGRKLSDHIVAALSGLLPSSSTQQAARMLDEGLPAVVSALAMREACDWHSASATWSQQGPSLTSSRAQKGARLVIFTAFPDGRLPFCLHLMFEAVKGAIVCVPGEGDTEQHGGPGSSGSQSIADRCFTHASMQVQRSLENVALFPSTGTAVGAAGEASRWALSLVALDELVSCHIALASLCDCSTLQVLALSLVRILCAPSIARSAEANVLALCLGTTYKAALVAVVEAINPLQGSCPEAIEQLQLVASKTVQNHVVESLELAEVEVAALVDMFAGV